MSITVAIVYHKNVPRKFFNLSLNSALAQIGLDFKIKIYTEGLKISHPDDRVSVCPIPNKLFGKLSAIREHIVNNTDTKYLAFWDSDDVYTIDRLYKQIRLIDRLSLDYCYSNFSFFNERKIFSYKYFEMIGFPQREIDIYDENYVGLGIVTAKVDEIRKLLPFPDIDNLDWWIAIKSKIHGFKSGYLTSVHGYYRLHGDSNSIKIKGIKNKDVIKEWKNKIKLYELLQFDDKELRKRYLFFKEMDINANMKQILDSYNQIKFKNIWGGIIPYEN